MSDPSIATQPPAAAEKKWLVWVKRGATAFIVIAGGVVAIAKLSESFVLPICDSKRALETLRGIFKEKNLPEPKLADAKQSTSTSDEKTCEVAYEIPNEKGMLDYRIYWEGKETKVMITKVRQ